MLPVVSAQAGMEGLDKARINAIIEEASRGSKFYTKQQEDQTRIDGQACSALTCSRTGAYVVLVGKRYFTPLLSKNYIFKPSRDFLVFSLRFRTLSYFPLSCIFFPPVLKKFVLDCSTGNTTFHLYQEERL
jgi:hypothetical protein